MTTTIKLLLLFLIFTIAIAQRGGHHPRLGKQQGRMSGSYHTVSDDQLKAMQTGGPFSEVQRVARFFYQAQTNKKLGDVLTVEKQVVSGINFKISFAAEAGSTDIVVISVFYQPWTKTIQISNIMPAIDGVTDESGRLLPDVEQPTINNN